MNGFEKVRPVEAYYFLSDIGIEKWDIKDAALAVLVYLALEGYLKDLEKSGDNNNLRSYEKEIVGLIKSEEYDKIVKVIRNYDFENFFVYNKAYKLKKTSKFWIFPSTETEKTEIGNEVFRETFGLRCDVFDHIINNLKLSEELIVASYAFPRYTRKYPSIRARASLFIDIGSFEEMLGYVDKTMQNVDNVISS